MYKTGEPADDACGRALRSRAEGFPEIGSCALRRGHLGRCKLAGDVVDIPLLPPVVYALCGAERVFREPCALDYPHTGYAHYHAPAPRRGFRFAPCPGPAHANPFIDNCSTCAPRWGWIEVPR